MTCGMSPRDRHPARTLLCPLFAAVALSGCFQTSLLFEEVSADSSSTTLPPDEMPTDPTDGSDEPDTGTSSTDATTTDAGTSSTGAPDSSSTGDDTTTATTTGDMPFPTCSFEPAGVAVGVMLSKDGVASNVTLRACGAAETWTPLRSVGFDGAVHHFQRCKDELCADCDPLDRLELGLAAPDPFGGPAAALHEGSCARLQVAWDRPLPGEEELCRPSMAALVELRNGAPEPIPAVLYRHTSSLPASDVIGDFELGAADAGAGAISCACEGDCCGEEPGSRRVDFAIAMAGDATEIPTMESQEAVQDIELVAVEGKPETGELALVRAFFPADCAAPPQHEWLFGRTTPAP